MTIFSHLHKNVHKLLQPFLWPNNQKSKTCTVVFPTNTPSYIVVTKSPFHFFRYAAISSFERYSALQEIQKNHHTCSSNVSSKMRSWFTLKHSLYIHCGLYPYDSMLY